MDLATTLLTAVRVGHGYDLHRLEPKPPAGKGRALIVGGVTLEFERGPIAHSDGDVLYHAVVDAILGALAQPDIGQLFPDNAPENEGRDSRDFMIAAHQKMHAMGYTIANLDATVILEKPRIGPVKEQMRKNLAGLLSVDVSRVNVKGKSHEKVDAVGESRAVEAHVVVLLVKAG
jgi:2-C-methyl-D-erythritol 2,4-cyclodiphosphate synthase